MSSELKFESSYTELRKEIITELKNQIGVDVRKISHLHGDFGTGKTLLVLDAKRALEKDLYEVLVIDEFFYKKEDIDGAISKINRKNFLKPKIDDEVQYKSTTKKIFNLLVWAFGATMALLAIYLPIFYQFNYVQKSLLWMVFVPLLVLLVTLIGRKDFRKVCCNFIAWKFPIRRKRNIKKIIIFENIDRNSWDEIIYLFNEVYLNVNRKNINYKVLFVYSMENLAIRYREKYGMDENLYLSLDKFIDKEFIISDYVDAVAPKIINQILGPRSFKINTDLIKNFRIVKRCGLFLQKHKELIEAFKLNEELVFYIYYLKISDNLAYRYLDKQFNTDEYQLSLVFDTWNNNQEKCWWDKKVERCNAGNGNDIPKSIQGSEQIVRAIIDLIKETKNNSRLHFISENEKEIFSKLKKAELEVEKSNYDDYINVLSEFKNSSLNGYFVDKLRENWKNISDNTKVKYFRNYISNQFSISVAVNAVNGIKFENLSASELQFLGVSFFKSIENHSYYVGLGNKVDYHYMPLSSIALHIKTFDKNKTKGFENKEEWKKVSDEALKIMNKILEMYSVKIKTFTVDWKEITVDSHLKFSFLESVIIKGLAKIEDLKEINEFLSANSHEKRIIDITLFNLLFSENLENYNDDINVMGDYGDIFTIKSLKKSTNFFSNVLNTRDVLIKVKEHWRLL